LERMHGVGKQNRLFTRQRNLKLQLLVYPLPSPQEREWPAQVFGFLDARPANQRRAFPKTRRT